MGDCKVDQRAGGVVSWGGPGTPLLPLGIRRAWSAEPLPRWVREDLGLPVNTTFWALGSDVVKDKPCAQRVKEFIVNKLRAEWTTVAERPAIAVEWPESLEHAAVPWRRRTRNCLSKAGLLGSTDALSSVSFGELLNIPGMGLRSVLDYSCTAEAAIERARRCGEGEDAPGQGDPADVDLDVLVDVIDSPWADQISAQDPRFRDLLPDSELTILERIDLATREPDEDPDEIRALAKAVAAVQQRAEEISQLPLEQALQSLLRGVSRLKDRRLEAISARLGWSGRSPVTLAEAGSIAGVTRERIRQLEKRTVERMPSHQVFMPKIDIALDLIAARAPLSFEDAAKALPDAGVSLAEFDPRALLAVAKICGRTPSIDIETIRGHTRVVTTPLGRRANAIISIACRQADASGATNIQEVLAEAESRGVNCAEEEILRILKLFSSVSFLGEDWFWRADGKPERNRLRNMSRKMLSITSPIDLVVLREGLRREYRYRGTRGLSTWPITVPPRAVLTLFYEEHPEFAVKDGMVSSTQDLDWRDELRPTERVLVEVLRSAPGCILDRASCVRACTEKGLNENTLSLYLSYCAIISHPSTDVWSLRGVPVDPVTVEAVRQASSDRPKARRVLDHGWTSSGRLWAAARLRESLGSWVFSIPGAIRHYVAGRSYPAVDESGATCGTVGITSEGLSYGYGPFLQRRGADEGDVLVVEFDLTEQRAILRLGDDVLLEEQAAQ